VCSFARGGHPNPIVLRADGTTQCLQADGSLLGIFANEAFATVTVQLHPGDRLVVFSDGVEVSFSGDGSIDTDQWRRELERRAPLKGEQFIASLADHIDAQAGSLSPKDDLTIILAEVN
jgi:serine phosphatase RsbU (regulator of sigma subunit)